MGDARSDGFTAAASAMGKMSGTDRCELVLAGRSVVLSFDGATNRLASRVTASTNGSTEATSVSDGGYRGAEPGARLEDPRPLCLRPETGLDRWAKRLRLARELVTGDAQFDNEVYVDSDDGDEKVRALLSSGPIRSGALTAVFAGASVHLFRAREDVQVVRSLGHNEIFDAPKLHAISRAAVEVASGLPPLRRTKVHSRYTPRLIFVSVFAVLGLLAFALYQRVADAHPLLLSDWVFVRYMLPAYPVVALAAYLGLRGRSSSHIHVLIVLAGALFAVPGVIGGSLLFANSRTEAPVVRHPAKLTKKIFSKTKSGTTYRLQLASWIPGREVLELSVPKSLYDEAGVGRDVEVSTQEGALGWTILRGIDPL